jgi:hypothetical protein
MIKNILIYLAYIAATIVFSRRSNYKFSQKFSRLLYIAKVKNKKYFPGKVFMRIVYILTSIGIILEFQEKNAILFFTLLITWILSTLYQMIDLKKEWRMFYIYENGYVFGGKEIYSEEEKPLQLENNSIQDFKIKNKVYQVEIIERLNNNIEEKVNEEKVIFKEGKEI